jgi:hypothetical protein
MSPLGWLLPGLVLPWIGLLIGTVIGLPWIAIVLVVGIVVFWFWKVGTTCGDGGGILGCWFALFIMLNALFAIVGAMAKLGMLTG